MTKRYCFSIFIASLIIYCSAGAANAQRHSKTLPGQKGIAQKKLATDSMLRRKIDSQLLQALAQQKSNGTGTENPVDVGADSKGNLPVDISATITDSLLHSITVLGGKIIYPSKEYHTVRAIINLSVVQTIALRRDVSFVRPAAQAQNNQMPAHPVLNQPDL